MSILQFQQQPREGPEKCPVYFRFSWIVTVILKFEKQSKSAIITCYGAVQPRILFSTRKILLAICIDAMPTATQNIVVYQHVCRCDCRYVSSTALRLQDRINQHVLRSIRNSRLSTKLFQNVPAK